MVNFSEFKISFIKLSKVFYILGINKIRVVNYVKQTHNLLL